MTPFITIETLFNPVLQANISDVVAKLQASCGISSLAAAQARITPLDGGSFNSTTNTITRSGTILTNTSSPHLLYNTSRLKTFRVDYSGCPNDPTFTTVVTTNLSAANMTSQNDTIRLTANYTPSGIYNMGHRGNFLFADDSNKIKDFRTAGDDQTTV